MGQALLARRSVPAPPENTVTIDSVPTRAARRQPPVLAIYLVLLAATLAVYLQAGRFDFVNFDDPDYTGRALTFPNFIWAMTAHDAANWFPVTRLTHLLDFTLFGAQAGPPHLINVLLHAAASMLLFAFLYRATDARWRSAFVAFLFALHPLHVESVAWIAERKDRAQRRLRLSLALGLRERPPHARARCLRAGPNVEAHAGHAATVAALAGLLAAP